MLPRAALPTLAATDGSRSTPAATSSIIITDLITGWLLIVEAHLTHPCLGLPVPEEVALTPHHIYLDNTFNHFDHFMIHSKASQIGSRRSSSICHPVARRIIIVSGLAHWSKGGYSHLEME